MSGERIMTCRNAKYPTTAILGVTHFRVVPSTTERTDPGIAGSPGRSAALVTDMGLAVELFGTDYAALLALVGSASANLVLGVFSASGGKEKITLKNVYFGSVPGGIEGAPKHVAGTVGEFCIRGTCDWGSSDTFALMMVAASDT
jgi:hypothetical protein